MKNRKKKMVKTQALVFSLLLLIALTYSVPAQASGTHVLVRPAYAQVDGATKYEFQKEYNASKKSIKAEYRATVNSLKKSLTFALATSHSKGERTEARRRFKEGLKAAQLRMNTALKEAKENYKKQISQ